MTTTEINIPLSDQERELIEQAADREGISFDQACSTFFSDGLAQRSRKRLGRKKKPNILNFNFLRRKP